jgi:hypothetical protein
MKLQTEIVIPSLLSITYNDTLLTIGSCFAENIGMRLEQYGFDTDTNPFGILYNPLSIATALERLLSAKPFDESELFHYNSLWHSFAHHGSFSAVLPADALETINRRFVSAAQRLPSTDCLLITFGTAWVYRQQGKVVANCHKLPDKKFARSRLSVDDIVALWKPLLQQLREINPAMRFLFTVSPIRHWKDGAHENQLSKAVLLLAIDRLKQEVDIAYFPAYELMMDELRDYRFYASDMLHPSEQAIDYIWERFVSACFDKEAHEIMREVKQIRLALSHRPLNPESEEYRRFQKQTLLRKTDFLQRYPTIKFD